MLDSSNGTTAPLVSIVLPTYNRARFLPQALESIREQSFTDWELIVVDDGSTDDTREWIAALSAKTPQPVRYVYQENQGAYAARNTGVELAAGRYVAFFDSDDLWLPHHLEHCVAALEANPEVDWVYGAGRMVDLATRKVLAPNTFYVNGEPRGFLKLRTRAAGSLRILEDPTTVECMILDGLCAGLQKSVLRRGLLVQYRFATGHRNEAEDQLFAIRILTGGRRMAYIDNVHLVYHVHAENSSGSALDTSVDKHLRVYQALARGYEELRGQARLTPAQSRALNRRLSQEYFWHLGYALLWRNGRRQEALRMFRRGLWLWPWNLGYWKTYLVALAKSLTGIGHRPVAGER